MHGGKYCVGQRKHYSSCNIQNCPPDTPDFREQQCQELDNNNFGIPGIDENVKWVPKYGVSQSDECHLYCRVDKKSNYFELRDKVVDGTPCSHDSFNKCINGICRQAGCDNKLDSDAVLDKCGVCNGNNSTCEDVRGIFTRDQLVKEPNSSTHYFQVVRIPKGALNIYIEQPSRNKGDTNYIALMDSRGEYILNGLNLINQHPHKFAYAGVTLHYTGANASVETVNTTYAVRMEKDLIVMVLILHPNNIRYDDELVRYSYTIAKTPNYYWSMSDWSNCDQHCMGNTYKKAMCIDQSSGLEVSSAFL